MKIKLTLLYTFSAVLILFPGCDDGNDDHCSYVKFVEASSGCYDPTVGLTLTATGSETDGKQYQWEVWVLKEKTDGFTPNDVIQVYNGLVVTLNDDQLAGNDLVMAHIITYCESEQPNSPYFKFTRETSGSCTTWTPVQ